MLKWIGLMTLSSLSLAKAPTEILADFDHQRLPVPSAKVETQVEVYSEGKMTDSSLYDVYVGLDNQSLAVFRNDKEKGQKVLMIGENFWLLMPKSKRPIRITPMQKLMGEASVGDIANLSWSEDYSADWLETGKSLVLTAAREGLSYQRVELLLDDEQRPTSANLYVSSGKLAKTAQFNYNDDFTQVLGMVLTDKIQQDEQTHVTYISTEAMDIPERYFNPSYLVKSKDL